MNKIPCLVPLRDENKKLIRDENGEKVLCGHMCDRIESSLINHFRHNHKWLSLGGRTKYKIRMLGDLLEANRKKKAARCNYQRERALQKVTGVS